MVERRLSWSRVDVGVLVGGILWSILVMVLPPYERLFFRADTSYYTALEYALREAVLSGQLPLWNRFLAEPLLANPQTMSLYPVAWLLRPLPIPAYLLVFAVTHLALLFVALYLLLRTWGFSRLASAASGGVIAFSVFVTCRVVVGHVTLVPVFGWSIFTLLFLSRLLHHARFSDFLLTTASAAMIILSGHTQYSLTGLLIPGSYVVFYVIASKFAPSALRRSLVYTAALGVCLLGLLAVQLIPTAEYFLLTARIGGMDFRAATLAELRPYAMLNYLMSYSAYDRIQYVNIQETIFFTTLAQPALLYITLWRTPQRYRGYAIYSLVLAAVAIVFALGSYTPAYGLVYDALPMFRAPGRFLLLLLLPLALIVAIAVERLWLQSQLKRRGLYALLANVVVVALLLAAYLYAGNRDNTVVILSVVVVGISTALWAIVAVFGLVTSGRRWVYLMVAALIADASLHGATFGMWLQAHPPQSDLILSDDGFACIARHTATEAGRFIDPTTTEVPTSSQTRGLANFGALVVPAGPANLALVDDLMSTRPELLRVTYQLSESLPDADWEWVPTGCSLDLYRHVGPTLPLAYAAHNLIPSDDTLATLGDTGIDLRRDAVVLEGDLQTAALTEFGGNDSPIDDDIQVNAYTANRVHLTARLSQSSLLVITDPYYPGWRAWVDGQSAPVWRVNHGVRGVPVEAGQHEIRLEYYPRSLRVGAALTSGTVILLAGVAFWRWRVARRSAFADFNVTMKSPFLELPL